MAEIAPFRGILYTPGAGRPPGDVSALVAPPYDVISEAERAALEARDPHNCVRLILPRPRPGEPDDSKYTAAADLLAAWLQDGSLARDERPAIYRYHQEYQAFGQTIVRRGFIARVRLRRFDEGVILPHERTLSGPKLDRLKLMRASHAHFSQVFGLYDDPERRTDALFRAVEADPAALTGTTADGVTQRLWRLTDDEAVRALVEQMADRAIYIADGHHRYETMITLRDELRAQAGLAPDAPSPADWGVMFFCNAADPGLLVFPTHRVLRDLPGFDRDALLAQARAWFHVEEGPLGDPEAARERLAQAATQGPAFGLVVPGSDTLAILRLRDDLPADAPLPPQEALRTLDVTVLHNLVLEALLGISRESQARQENLGYVKSWDGALRERNAPGVQAVFLMNPTRVEQVMAVADAGEVMPQKSTYFYPKIASGLVVNPIE